MDTRTERRPMSSGAGPVALEPRQRWRLTFARAGSPDAESLAGREYIATWEAALTESGLPLATTDSGRFRFALAAPLPARTTGAAELADLWLTERAAAWQVREAIDGVMPAGHELVALEDVWLGSPPLSGRVAAADYVVALEGSADGPSIAAACDRLLAAERLVRERAKGGGVKTYDLRPLLIALEVVTSADGGPVAVRLRARIHPELGSGRPEEVVAALAEELGAPLQRVETIRERLVLVDDLGG